NDYQSPIRLRLALGAHDGGRVIQTFNSVCAFLISSQPTHHQTVWSAVSAFKRRRHIDDSPNEFGFHILGHCLIAGVKSLLREPIAVRQFRDTTVSHRVGGTPPRALDDRCHRLLLANSLAAVSTYFSRSVTLMRPSNGKAAGWHAGGFDGYSGFQ